MISLIGNNFKLDNIDTILFDKDGTIIDLHFFWGKMTELRILEIIQQYKISDTYFNELCLCLGYNSNTGKMVADGITALYSRTKIIDIFKKDLAKYGISITNKDLENLFDKVSEKFYKDMINYVKPIPDAIDFIKNIRNLGIKTGIVTADSIESTNITLKHYNWTDLFDVVIGRETIEATKESGIPVKHAIELLNSKKENTIMIGDTPTDYIAAKNAEIENVILVATGQINFEKLKETTPYVLHSLSDLKSL